MALVNIDEYNAKTEREQAKIKRILAEKDVQVRKMRSDQYIRTQRTASFHRLVHRYNELAYPTDRPDGFTPLYLLSGTRHHQHRADRQLPTALCPGRLRNQAWRTLLPHARGRTAHGTA